MGRCVRFGVVGAGIFGNFHANKCAENSMIDFIGVYDLDKASAFAVAQKHNVTAFETYDDMLEDVEAVIIACAAQNHAAMSLEALKSGKHCLIEKPLAADLESAQKILDLSQNAKLIVQAGHQERFVMKAIGLDKVPEIPISIQASRMSAYNSRGTDVSVTLDLMSHDLDLVLWLLGAFPNKITATTEIIKSTTIDKCHVKLEFPKGFAELTSSRVSDSSKRCMEIEYPSGKVYIDFNAKTVQHDTPFDLDSDFAQNPIARDSLGAATDSFVKSILQATPIAITAQNGYDAVKLAVLIDQAGM
ncbi:MAG: Gfo/Idh/MocA family oxidoreductase [Litorimonas sp.]